MLSFEKRNNRINLQNIAGVSNTFLLKLQLICQWSKIKFVRLYPGMPAQLPAIFVREDGQSPSVVVDRNQLENIDDVVGLKTVLGNALERSCGHLA